MIGEECHMFSYVFLELCHISSRLTIYLKEEETELIKSRYLEKISYVKNSVE